MHKAAKKEKPVEKGLVKEEDSPSEAAGISMIPSDAKDMKPEETPSGRGTLYIGKDAADLSPVILDLTKQYLLLISSKEDGLRDQMLKRVKEQLSGKEAHQILQLKPDNIKKMREQLEQVLNDRRNSYRQHKKEPDFDAKIWLEGFTQLCLIIDDPAALAEAMDGGDLKSFRRIFTKSLSLGVLIIISAPNTIFSISEPDILTDAILSAGQVLALDGRPSDYTKGYSLQTPEAGILLDEDEMAWICKEDMRIIRV
jgi:hypothetical protein